ncbi:MAG: hypothetical protein V1809_07690, partial [Planctomycetota bacterium]
VIEPFPPEFAASDDAGAEILAAARSTGGGPRGTIPPRQTARRDERAVWTWCVLAAAVVLAMDVAFRRMWGQGG